MAVTNYMTFGGMIVHENRGGVQRDCVPDTLGFTAALVDTTQTITDRWEYWPYGEVAQRTGTRPAPFTFVRTLGYFRDLLDTLIYVRARYYRPQLLRRCREMEPPRPRPIPKPQACATESRAWV